MLSCEKALNKISIILENMFGSCPNDQYGVEPHSESCAEVCGQFSTQIHECWKAYARIEEKQPMILRMVHFDFKPGVNGSVFLITFVFDSDTKVLEIPMEASTDEVAELMNAAALLIKQMTPVGEEIS